MDQEHEVTENGRDLRARRALHDAEGQDGSETEKSAMAGLQSAPDAAVLEAPVSKRWSLVILLSFFSLASVVLYSTYTNFPVLHESERSHIKLPTSIEDAKQLGLVLTKYRTEYYLQVMSAFSLTYIVLQTFAIPGSIFLSFLSGYLFQPFTALLLVCTCSATGATFCYVLTSLVGRRIVVNYFPERVKKWSAQVDRHREHLLNYIIFLRITPFLPNWFINIASPVINVDIIPFTLGTFIGVAPPSFVAIQAGTTLYEMTESTSTFTWYNILFLAALAAASLLPVLFKTRLRSRLE